MPEFAPETVALVTGAASGISLAVAKQLVREGVTNLALIDINKTGVTAAADSLKALNLFVKALTLAGDCSSEEQVDAAVAEVVENFGRIDVVFNGAGLSGEAAPIAEQSTANLDRVLGVNLRGLWLVEKAVITQMLKQGERAVTTGLPLKTRGSIVNAGSLTSSFAIDNLSPYIISKHGVVGLTKADANDYAMKGIRVNAVCPGWILTNMTQSLLESEIIASEIPRPVLYGVFEGQDLA